MSITRVNADLCNDGNVVSKTLVPDLIIERKTGLHKNIDDFIKYTILYFILLNEQKNFYCK